MTQNNTQKATGTLRNDQNRLIFKKGFSFSGYERDALFMNRDGKKFMDISGISGIDSINIEEKNTEIAQHYFCSPN